MPSFPLPIAEAPVSGPQNLSAPSLTVSGGCRGTRVKALNKLSPPALRLEMERRALRSKCSSVDAEVLAAMSARKSTKQATGPKSMWNRASPSCWPYTRRTASRVCGQAVLPENNAFRLDMNASSFSLPIATRSDLAALAHGLLGLGARAWACNWLASLDGMPAFEISSHKATTDSQNCSTWLCSVVKMPRALS